MKLDIMRALNFVGPVVAEKKAKYFTQITPAWALKLQLLVDNSKSNEPLEVGYTIIDMADFELCFNLLKCIGIEDFRAGGTPKQLMICQVSDFPDAESMQTTIQQNRSSR